MKKKKSVKPAKKATVKKAAAKKPEAKKAPVKPATAGRKPVPARPAASTDGGGRQAAYAPQPIQGIGWKPFRYPPE